MGQAEDFDGQRGRLLALAQRLLGRREDAEDAVQEAWVRLQHQPAGEVRSSGAWLTAVVTRLCLDELRRRKRRQSQDEASAADPLDAHPGAPADPEAQAALADAVGAALLIVLDRLPPAERVAFLLHDVFDLPFEAIAPLVERSVAATRQLASRARRRVRGDARGPASDLAERRRLAERFLDAARTGDLGGLLALLQPDVALRPDHDAASLPGGQGGETVGAERVAAFFARVGAGAAHLAWVDGQIAILVAPGDQLLLVLTPTFLDARIASLEAIASPSSLAAMRITLGDLG